MNQTANVQPEFPSMWNTMISSAMGEYQFFWGINWDEWYGISDDQYLKNHGMGKYTDTTAARQAHIVKGEQTRAKIYSCVKLYPELTAEQVAQKSNVNKSTALKHLQALRKNGLIESIKITKTYWREIKESLKCSAQNAINQFDLHRQIEGIGS